MFLESIFLQFSAGLGPEQMSFWGHAKNPDVECGSFVQKPELGCAFCGWLFPQERDNDLEPLSCHLHVDAAFRLEESSSSTAHLTSSPLGILDTTSAIPLCFAEQKERRQERRTYTQGEGEGWQGEREMSTQRKV